MISIESIGVAAMVLSNFVAYIALKRLRKKEKREDQERVNQQKWVV